MPDVGAPGGDNQLLTFGAAHPSTEAAPDQVSAGMIGKQIAVLQLPNQALFSLKAAARYLGISPDALVEDTALGLIKCYDFHGRRTYKIEDLEKLRESLPEWHNRPRPMPVSAIERKSKHVQ